MVVRWEMIAQSASWCPWKSDQKWILTYKDQPWTLLKLFWNFFELFWTKNVLLINILPYIIDA